MKLIIAEKKSLADSIIAAIPGQANYLDGYATVGDYSVTWAWGHLIELQMPDQVDAKYKQWNITDLPITFNPWPVQVNNSQRNKKQFKVVANLLKKANQVIHAGDPDDEGQLIVDEILEFTGYTGSVLRLSTNDNNVQVIKKALNRLEPNEKFYAEGRAAYARSVSDAIFGLNLSRFYSCLSHQNLSIGRVQTPTLGLVVNRDYLIDNHIKKTFYNLLLAVTGTSGAKIELTYVIKDTDPVDEDGHITDPAFFHELIKNLGQKKGTLEVSKKNESKGAFLPFNLAKLQAEANKRFGFGAKKTLELTQALRDKYKAITYNRSDCQYLNDEHFSEAPTLLEQIQENLGQKHQGLSTDKKPRCFNNSKVTAHHAIIPTNKTVDLSAMSNDERNLYTLIAQYYLVQFMPPAVYEKTTAELVLDKHLFKATASVRQSAGWHSVLGISDDSEPQLLTKIPEGSYPCDYDSYRLAEGTTKPPARYTEGTLIADMSNIAKYVKNPQVKQLLLDKDADIDSQNGSIGTPATRDSIIETLLKRGFIERKKKQIISTELGKQFYNGIPEIAKSIDMTAYWWKIQEQIKSGEKSADFLIDTAINTVTKIIEKGADGAPNLPKGQKKTANNNEWKSDVCPDCGGAIHFIDLPNKTSFWGHKDRETDCPTRFDDKDGKPVKKAIPAQSTEYSCPACGKGYLQRRKSKKGNYWWSCNNYPTCKQRYFDDDGKPQFEDKPKANLEAELPGTTKRLPNSTNSKKFLCTHCQKGSLVKRDGKYGVFWGCSNYKGGCKAQYKDDNGKPKL